MKFARITFWIAGVLVLTPMYFMYGKVGTYSPPSLSHPEFYYGFVGVTLAWQFVFFVSARDPVRYRPMIVPSNLEKLSYVAAVALLYVQSRIPDLQLLAAAPDTFLSLLFVSAFLKTRSVEIAKIKESTIFGGV
jgi:hypothetical protein